MIYYSDLSAKEIIGGTIIVGIPAVIAYIVVSMANVAWGG